MSKNIVDNKLWNSVEHIIPPKTLNGSRGRQPIPDRAALNGILFVLKAGIPFSGLPEEVGAGSGLSCWRRLREWQSNGTWNRLQRVFKRDPKIAKLNLSRFDESHFRSAVPVHLMSPQEMRRRKNRKNAVKSAAKS